MSIELHIERLVIDAALLGGERATDVRATLERELGQQLAQAGAIDTLHSLGTVAALPPMTLPAAVRLHEPFGARVASAVRQSLGLNTTMHHGGALRHG
ncbi:hypothetical protein RHOFW510R12_03480 [Rhodanobacter sp. FW510-R12]|uniref:hypothetical protein n=1 Tax=unclassified Rhodanobacter TaxID=2621553 RepID=UPI0007A9A78F|nr:MULTISPECIES: hypothetical protein [unclassified Rhodanobacter]KZC17921.1 hypothetical protein RHOFW104R8_08470 [Rhodanobacter sp. FW104-R8]KZC25618.1 hypothetical protein RhoFW510T8_06820 [Rhodanobacter sp. FW510-T8]KZC32820.1 hypothetical protein RhoFW510R10_10900 [Rhodanobacter sp. FW510-R10]